MKPIRISKQINAPRERVFELATDFANLDEIISGIAQSELLTDGPVEVGTRFRETRTIMGKSSTEEMEVTAIDPPHSYCLEAESCGCHYVTWHRFVDKDGGTEVTMEFTGKPVTLAARLMSLATFMMSGMLKKMITADLDDLAAEAEAVCGGAQTS